MLSKFSGYKCYLGIAAAALALIAHAAGATIPGVMVDDGAIMQNLWLLFMGAATRSAIAKVAGPQDLALLTKALTAFAAAASASTTEKAK